MNALKNMEAIFVVAAVLLSVTSYATAAAPVARIQQVSQTKQAAAAPVKMNVVTVKGKRWTAAQKAAFA